MTDPRATVVFDGLQAQYATYKIDGTTISYDVAQVGGSASVGKAVKMSTDDTVILTTDGSDVEGKLIKVEADDMATVQHGGFCTLPGGVGAALTLGKKIVGAVDALGAGGCIREVATATAAELGLARGAIINNDTTTAVVVRL